MAAILYRPWLSYTGRSFKSGTVACAQANFSPPSSSGDIEKFLETRYSRGKTGLKTGASGVDFFSIAV